MKSRVLPASMMLAVVSLTPHNVVVVGNEIGIAQQQDFVHQDLPIKTRQCFRLMHGYVRIGIMALRSGALLRPGLVSGAARARWS